MNFEFATTARIRFGAGVLKEVGPGAKYLGQRALVVTGSHPQRAQKLLALLAENGVTATTFAVAGEPEIATIDAGVAAGRPGGLRPGDCLWRRQRARRRESHGRLADQRRRFAGLPGNRWRGQPLARLRCR